MPATPTPVVAGGVMVWELVREGYRGR